MSNRTEPSLGVHLLAGLPTEVVQWGFERACDLMPVVPMDALGDFDGGRVTQLGVLLPPFVEPSQVVESWEECEFLPHRFGRPAHIAGVSTFIDVDRMAEHLASAAPLSLHGWGRSERDRRTVADLLVEQIEPASHLVLVGVTPLADALARCLGVLNPGAHRIPLRSGSRLELNAFAVALGSDRLGDSARGGVPHREHRPDPMRRDAGVARSAQVVPPWRQALHGEGEPSPDSGVFVYRRARPFDPRRFGDWLANPPRDLVRGKGQVWISSDATRSYGYSCAGSVHRLFPGGRWWASCTDGQWPNCPSQRRRLLERWHPRFGDRRQEIAFVGVDLDCGRLRAELDACLLAEKSIRDALHPLQGDGWEAPSSPSPRLH